MTTAKDSKPAELAAGVHKAQGKVGHAAGQVTDRVEKPLLTAGDKEGGMVGLSAAFLVGAAVGMIAGADQQPAHGADVRLLLDDEPKDGKHADRQNDYGCGL